MYIPFPILPSFPFFPFVKNFHFGIIVDSHAVVRNHKEGSLVPFTKYLPIETSCRASLVAQWLRICLPMQGTRVRALVWEDPTCHGATEPVSPNY